MVFSTCQVKTKVIKKMKEVIEIQTGVLEVKKATPGRGSLLILLTKQQYLFGIFFKQVMLTCLPVSRALRYL